MDKSNISQGIPPEVLALIQGKLIECRDAISPYVVTLTADERRKAYKASDGSEAFLEKGMSYAKLFPKLVPQQLDIKELETMYGVMVGLMPIAQLAMDFVAGITDTKMTASSETMHGTLSFYNSAKQAARENVPGAKTAYTDMKKRYERKKKSEADEVLMVTNEKNEKAV